jgi:hypothetical protein
VLGGKNLLAREPLCTRGRVTIGLLPDFAGRDKMAKQLLERPSHGRCSGVGLSAYLMGGGWALDSDAAAHRPEQRSVLGV